MYTIPGDRNGIEREKKKKKQRRVEWNGSSISNASRADRELAAISSSHFHVFIFTPFIFVFVSDFESPLDSSCARKKVGRSQQDLPLVTAAVLRSEAAGYRANCTCK